MEEHIKSLGTALAGAYEVSYLYPERGALHLRNHRGEITSLPVPEVAWPVTQFSDDHFDRALTTLLKQAAPDLIHLHHFINYPLSILSLVHECSVPVFISHHDYFAITPHYTMQGVRDPKLCTSAVYAAKIFGQDIASYLQERQRFIAAAFARTHRHIAPSQALATTLRSLYDIPITVIPHGITPFTAREKTPSSALRFGYVGSILPQKGWEFLAKTFISLGIPADVATLHFYGGSFNHPYPDKISVHGVYNQQDLPQITSSIDIGIIPSLFAETFSLVLSELWMGNTPVIAPRFGAFPERIREDIDGKLFTPGDPQALGAAITSCIKERDTQRWQITPPRTVTEMAHDYSTLYQEHLSS